MSKPAIGRKEFIMQPFEQNTERNRSSAPTRAANLFLYTWFIISQHRLGLTKHLKTSSAYHTGQRRVPTSACLQLSAGAIFGQVFIRSITNHTNTHVTDTCAINFTNLFFSSACITLQDVARAKSKGTQNYMCSFGNKAYLGLCFRQCCQCKPGVFRVLFAQLTLICSNNGMGLWWRLFIGCQGLRSSRGSLRGYKLHHIHTARQKAASLLMSKTSIDSQFCFYSHHASLLKPAVNANLFHPQQSDVCFTL